MSRHLIVAYQPGAEARILDWVWFRTTEGVDAFHVIVHRRVADPEAALDLLICGVELLGATATGEIRSEGPAWVLRRQVPDAGCAGVILAAPGDRLGRLKRTVSRVQRRHEIGIVWVDPLQGLPLRRSEARERLRLCPSGNDGPTLGATADSEGGEAA